jgi:hypothetical protein
MKGNGLPDLGRLAGIGTSAEFVRAGIPRARIQKLAASGVLVRLAPGVYASAEQAATIASTPGGDGALRVVAAIAVCGPEAVGSHQDAAMIHELETLTRMGPGPVALTRPRDAPHSRRTRPSIQLHMAAVPPEHKVTRHGVPVTSAARTVVDLARTTSSKEGVVVADSALRSKKCTRAELDRVLGSCAHWPGITRARRVVGFSDARSESVFESIARVEFDAGGLPAPELQAWVGGDGVVIGRADFFWRDYSTIAEADGAMKYSDPDRARMQLERDARLREAGFEVVHFGWHDLRISPGQVVRAIRAAFARSEALRAAEALRTANVLRQSVPVTARVDRR